MIYQNRKEDINAELLERVSAGKRGYVIYERDGHRYMRIVSTAKMPATEKTYYLETISDMDTVYVQRDEMIRLYQYVVCILLGACVGISLGLSYLLTHRLSKLSESASQFIRQLLQTLSLRVDIIRSFDPFFR